MTQSPISFFAGVEGSADEVVLRKVLESLGASLGAVYGRSGKGKLLNQLYNYNQAAHFHPWIVLIDLDRDAACAPSARAMWLATPAPKMCFRIVVREVESWLMADRGTMAAFLGVAESRIPIRPELLDNPKETLVHLARGSRRRIIQQDMTPLPGSGRSIGPAYTSRVIEYALNHWRPEIASKNADSLSRLCNRVTHMMKNL